LTGDSMNLNNSKLNESIYSRIEDSKSN
jgi:hypothetical protein